jgi:3-deoxy-D-manno-octulosonic-acid transferase
MFFLYNILLVIGITIGVPLIIPLVLTSDKRRKTVLHRLGISPLPKAISQNRLQKGNNRPIWIHALSVGEVVSAVPLIKKIKNCFKHQDIVFSASIVIIVESDIWPNFLFEMKKRNVPVILVNARLSRRSYFGYKLFLFFTKRLFLSFSKICVQSSEDAHRFSLLGIPPGRITITGNIKFDQD